MKTGIWDRVTPQVPHQAVSVLQASAVRCLVSPAASAAAAAYPSAVRVKPFQKGPASVEGY
jgi:hypothetical protein